MIPADRDLEKLRPDVRAAFEKLAGLATRVGIDIMLTEGFRTPERQAFLYAQGRTAPGRIVTRAKPGRSDHEAVDELGNPASRAFDVCFVEKRNEEGKPIAVTWVGPWRTLAGLAVEYCGLEWGGDWSRPDRPHFYRT